MSSYSSTLWELDCILIIVQGKIDEQTADDCSMFHTEATRALLDFKLTTALLSKTPVQVVPARHAHSLHCHRHVLHTRTVLRKRSYFFFFFVAVHGIPKDERFFLPLKTPLADFARVVCPEE